MELGFFVGRCLCETLAFRIVMVKFYKSVVIFRVCDFKKIYKFGRLN